MRYDKLRLYKSGLKMTAVGIFKMDVDNLRWLDASKDDADDLCLHGHAVAYIGNRKLEYECTVSATALYLLKSLTEDHIMCEDNQILPCCGFLIFQMKHLIML